MLTRFGGAAASFRRSFDAMPEEERDAAGEGRLLQAFGGPGLFPDARRLARGVRPGRRAGSTAPPCGGFPACSSGSGMPDAVSRKMPDSVTRWPSMPSSPACAPRSAAGRRTPGGLCRGTVPHPAGRPRPSARRPAGPCGHPRRLVPRPSGLPARPSGQAGRDPGAAPRFPAVHAADLSRSRAPRRV